MPPKADVPFNSSRSWLLGIFGVGEGSIRPLAITLAVIAAIGFVLGGGGWLAAQGWGRSLAVWSAVVSILLVVLYFNPWLSLAVLINAAIVYQLLR